MSLAAVLICAFFGAYWMGRNAGYREGLFDGIEIEREAWNDSGPDDGGGEEIDSRRLTYAEIRALAGEPGGIESGAGRLKLVRGRKEPA